MAKGSRQRAMPSTPGQRTEREAPPDEFQDQTTGDGGPGSSAPVARRPQTPEADYLVRGTGCVRGHARGQELISAGIGRVPTKKAARIGVALVLWCYLGVSFFVDMKWLVVGFQILMLWLAFSAVVQRRSGHRGKCWRTRSWRHAWGGLLPTVKDPTRPAGT